MNKLQVEIADTPSRREIGLMHRKHLGKNEGMIFKFSHPDCLSFWMKNTHIPLDIAFIRDNGEIFQISQMYPLSTRTTNAKEACRYALEVNQGWFKENGLKEGCKLKGLFFKNVKTAQNQQNQQNQQVNQEVNINLSNREKIKYAEDHGLKMRILYIADGGWNVGPRIISPINGKYPLEMYPQGEIFKAYDESPTIEGKNPDWKSEGGTIKNFYIEYVDKLEVLDAQGQPLKTLKGQPMEDVQVEPEISEIEAKKLVKKSIPGLNDAQWEKMKDDVMSGMKIGTDISEIIWNVKTYFMSLFNKFRKK